MKKIILFALLILASSMILGCMTNTAQAEVDPSILLKIAKQAQRQLENQMDKDVSDKTKHLFIEGTQEIKDLEESIKNNDIDLSKKHFMSIMGIFKEVSHQLSNIKSTQPEMITLKAPSKASHADLFRMQNYADNLKIIAKKYDAPIDFSELDDLFVTARKQISDKQFDDAVKTIDKIKQITADFNNKIREYASQQEQSRALAYAKKYLERLDRLIENAKSQGLSENIIQKLETIKENLSSTTNPHEIIKHIREIISIKEQFDLNS